MVLLWGGGGWGEGCDGFDSISKHGIKIRYSIFIDHDG